MTDETKTAAPIPPADSDLELGDDPVDEAPFSAEELLRLARHAGLL